MMNYCLFRLPGSPNLQYKFYAYTNYIVYDFVLNLMGYDLKLVS